jgi:hypothetical protein
LQQASLVVVDFAFLEIDDQRKNLREKESVNHSNTIRDYENQPEDDPPEAFLGGSLGLMKVGEGPWG